MCVCDGAGHSSRCVCVGAGHGSVCVCGGRSQLGVCDGRLQLARQGGEDEGELGVALLLGHAGSSTAPQQTLLEVCPEHLQQALLRPEPCTHTHGGELGVCV